MSGDSENFGDRFRKYRRLHDINQDVLAERLGLSRNYVSMIEGGRDPSDVVKKHFETLENSPITRLREEGVSGNAADLAHGLKKKAARLVPVISWAQAGEGTDFQELPPWDYVPSDSLDPHAIGLIIKGPSMEPKHWEGEIAIVTPSIRAKSGDLVVARLRNEGVVFKIFNLVGPDGKTFRLSSFNEAYPPREFQEKDFFWIHPVDSIVNKLRR